MEYSKQLSKQVIYFKEIILKRLSYEEIKEFLRFYGYKLLEKNCFGVKEKIHLEDSDGFLYYLEFGSLKHHLIKNKSFKPLRFSPNNPNAIENIRLWLVKKEKPFVFEKGELISNSDVSLWFRCLECGEIWNCCWCSIYNMGTGCPYCNGKRVGKLNSLILARPDLANEWDYEKNYPLTPFDVAPRSDKPIWWICKKGHSFQSMPSNRNNNDTSRRTNCPICKESKGEMRIRNFLLEKRILFEPQKIFEGCVGKSSLFFDFYLVDYNLCIEYQGEQHYRPTFKSRNKTAKETYQAQQKNDAIKRQFCKEHEINLLEISYQEFDNIEKVLSNYLI
jgi:hypothetical protein